MVSGELNRKNIEILICTHYDANHINGVIGLIKLRIKITEVWLPSIFARVIKSMEFFEKEDYEDEETEIADRKLLRTQSMRKRYLNVIIKILPKIYELINALLLIKDKTTI